MHPYHHALSSVRRFGGDVGDYLPIHDFFDSSKQHFADFRHRALRHHTLGIFQAEHTFGVTITNSDGKEVPVRLIAEQHIQEDLGFIPTVADWLRAIQVKPWMRRKQTNNPVMYEDAIDGDDLTRSARGSRQFLEEPIAE